MGNIIFITGTDTGAGKTLLTALLLTHLRRRGRKAWAMKPFCSGPRNDVELLYKLQSGELSRDLINPFHFDEPLAPLVAARRRGRDVALAEVVFRVRSLQAHCDVLLVEGAGGVLVPLGEGYSVADLIKALGCRVVIAARNKLGVINHARLTMRALQSSGINGVKIVLMNRKAVDLASKSNRRILAELVSPVEVSVIPFLGPGRPLCGKSKAKKVEKKIQKTLARITKTDTFYTHYGSGGRKRSEIKKLLTVCGNEVT